MYRDQWDYQELIRICHPTLDQEAWFRSTGRNWLKDSDEALSYLRSFGVPAMGYIAETVHLPIGGPPP